MCSIRSVPSIQVLDSNIRTTYSVPTDVDTESESENGNEDDVLEISSSSSSASEIAEPGEQTTTSNITTPDHKSFHEALQALREPQAESSQASVPSFSSLRTGQFKKAEEALQVPDIQGSSQGYPINLEVETSHMVIESDEDGPEVLPIQVSRKRSAIVDLLNDRPPSSSGMSKSSTKAFIDPLMASTNHPDPRSHEDRDSVRRESDERETNEPPIPFPAFGSSRMTHLDNHTPNPSDAALARILNSTQPAQASQNNALPSYHTNFSCNPGPTLGIPEMHASVGRSQYLRLPPVGSPTMIIEPAYSNTACIMNGWSDDTSPCLEAAEPHQSGPTPPKSSENVHLQSSVASWETPTANIADEHTIRPDISNLVNSYHADIGKSLKRKAEEMARDETSSGPTQESYVSSAEKTQAHAHDAQPREPPVVAETETFVTQSESDDGVVSSATKTLTTETTAVTEEPRRKRSKTSSPASAPANSSMGIGKFVSGVCLGVVGAAVAFIATIPASVHEEALREL